MNQTQKKILYITSRADIGGGPLALKWLIESLNEIDPNPVEIFVAAPINQKFTATYKENCKEFYPIPYRSFSLISFIGLYLFIKRNKISSIHTMGRGASIYGFMCALLLRRNETKWFHTFHGLHYGHSAFDLFKKFVDKIIFHHFVDGVFTLSLDEKNTAHEFLKISEDRIFPIKNYVTKRINQFKSTLDRTKLRQKWAIPQGKIAVGIMGRNDLVKGLEVLNVKLTEIEKSYPGKFYFINASDILPEEEGAWEFLSVIDIYLSHSIREGSPLVVFESLELGSPCVLSDIPGHREFTSFHPQKDALTFFPLKGTASDLAEIMLSVANKSRSLENSSTAMLEESHLKSLLLRYV